MQDQLEQVPDLGTEEVTVLGPGLFFLGGVPARHCGFEAWLGADGKLGRRCDAAKLLRNE